MTEKTESNMFRDVVVVGASAGGIKALRQLVRYLPEDLPAAVLVTTHLSPTAPKGTAAALSGVDGFPIGDAVDGRAMMPGRIDGGVPDRHLIIDDGDVLRLSRGPRENRVRPAVDTLFRSAARWCGPRVIGVVLSGSLDDGAAGLAAIVERGGTALVQDPGEAGFDGMPRAALAAVPAATALPVALLAKRIAELAGKPVQPSPAAPSEALIWETDMIRGGATGPVTAGEPVGLGCPECSGGMRAVTNGNAVHYVCHTGHSYSPQTFLAARDDGIEAALWTAVSAMQEKAMVLRQLAVAAHDSGDETAHQRHHAEVDRIDRAEQLLRTQLVGGEFPAAG